MVLLQPRRSGVLKGLFEALYTICRLSTDAQAITCAIRHRIFYILIQLEKLNIVDVQPMFDLVAGALVTPAALKAFHNSLRLVSRYERQSLRDKVAHIIVTYAERYKLIEEWGKEWPDLQTCRRRDVSARFCTKSKVLTSHCISVPQSRIDRFARLSMR